MSREENTRQHFVPKCYLKYFLGGKSDCCAYDKVQNKAHPITLNSFCYENFLYDIDSQFATLDDGTNNSKYIEKNFFYDIETEYSKFLEEINNSLSDIYKNGVFPEKMRQKLAYFIVIQFLRMPKVKEETKRFNDAFMPEMLSIFKEGLAKESGDDNLEKLNINAKFDASRMHFKQNFGNDEIVGEFVNAILNNRWIFVFSSEGDFYTSDTPCVVHQSINSRPLCMGLAQYGSEIIFPIIPKLAVIIYDRNFYTDLEVPDNSVNAASYEHIAHINLNIYENAYRFVISKKSDFDIINQYIQDNG